MYCVFIFFLPTNFITEWTATDFPASLKLNALKKVFFLSHEYEIINFDLYLPLFFCFLTKTFPSCLM